MKLLKHYILLIFLFSFCVGNAQDQTANQYWGDYSLIKSLTELSNFHGTFGYIVSSPRAWRRVYAEGMYNHKWPEKFLFKKLNHEEYLSGGLAIYYTNNFDASNSLEIRPSQSFSLSWPNTKRLKIKHRVRLEERFEIETDDWTNTFGLRLGYKFTMIYKLQGKVLSFNKGFYIPISINLWWSLVQTAQFNDQARFTPGLGYVFSPKWKGEFLVGYNFSKSTDNGEYQANGMIFRLRVFHTQGGK